VENKHTRTPYHFLIKKKEERLAGKGRPNICRGVITRDFKEKKGVPLKGRRRRCKGEKNTIWMGDASRKKKSKAQHEKKACRVQEGKGPRENGLRSFRSHVVDGDTRDYEDSEEALAPGKGEAEREKKNGGPCSRSGEEKTRPQTLKVKMDTGEGITA